MLRNPLGEIPNAVNSPATRNQKRSHQQYAADLEVKPWQAFDFHLADENEPPPQSKRLYVDPASTVLAAQRDDTIIKSPRSRVPPLTSYAIEHVEKSQKLRSGQDSLDSIRQWQRHYKKAFFSFVFYFDALPEEDRGRYSKVIRSLGAVSCLLARSFVLHHSVFSR